MCRLALALWFVVCVCGGAVAQSFLTESQLEDGHWSATAFGGKAEAELRVNAWIALALLGDGSTLRSGPYKNQVKGAVKWLLAQQDDKGRFALRTDPDWLLDQAIATFALAEAERVSNYEKVLRPKVLAAVDALQTALAQARPAPGPETLLWARFVVQSLRFSTGDERHAAADKLAAVLAASAVPAGRSARERAAVELLTVLGVSARLLADAGDGKAPADTAAPAAPALLPDDPVADPLHTFYVAVAAIQRGGAGWDATKKTLEGVVKAQRKDGDRALRGSFDPTGAFGDANGRLGATAIHMLSLEIYYRYCRLSLFE